MTRCSLIVQKLRVIEALRLSILSVKSSDLSIKWENRIYILLSVQA